MIRFDSRVIRNTLLREKNRDMNHMDLLKKGVRPSKNKARMCADLFERVLDSVSADDHCLDGLGSSGKKMCVEHFIGRLSLQESVGRIENEEIRSGSGFQAS